MIKKMRIQINYVLCLMFVAGIFVLPLDPPARPMGCETSTGSVCTI